MDKVKVTREQAKIIDSESKYGYKDDFMARHSRVIAKNESGWTGELRSLNDISIFDMAKILYGDGYEAEEEYKIGDWVVRTKDNGWKREKNKIFNVFRVDDDDVEEVYENGTMIHQRINIRHATEEEIHKEKENRLTKEITEKIPQLKHWQKSSLLKQFERWEID